MAERSTRPTARTPDFRKVIQVLEESKLVDLDRPVRDFVGVAGRLAAEIDGDAICWVHYMVVFPHQDLEDLVTVGQQG